MSVHASYRAFRKTGFPFEQVLRNTEVALIDFKDLPVFEVNKRFMLTSSGKGN